MRAADAESARARSVCDALSNSLDEPIVGTMEESALEPAVQGLTLEAGGNRTGLRYEDGRVVGVSSFGWSTANIDDRSFLFVPQDGGERTRIFELDDAGAANQVYEVVGDAQWSRVR